jgi:succinate dehydrogenase flavin-adding protein (antitoxin of CptAB toxin-antitoxin module)
MRKVTVTVDYYDEEIELLQASADDMTAWCAARGEPKTWTLEMIVRVNALAKAREDTWERKRKAESVNQP